MQSDQLLWRRRVCIMLRRRLTNTSGAFEEEKLRLTLQEIDLGSRHSFHIILHGGRKVRLFRGVN